MSFFWFLLGIFVLVLLARYVAFGSRLGLLALSVTPPAQQMAAPILAPNCSIPQNPATLQGINANTVGGVFRAPQIQIPAGLALQLTSTLILVADQHLQVDGTITLNAAAAPAGRMVNIVLVCLNGNVVIGPQAQVGGTLTQAPAGTAATATAATAIASGGAGTNGGYVKLVAQLGSIDIQGVVEGFGGGNGGNATATGAAVPAAWGAFQIGGEAVAVGGQSGAGGDVKLCAYEAINVAGNVRGGMGGQGGHAMANAVNGEEAYAASGHSNRGGDVLIEGLSTTMQVFNTGSIEGGPVLMAGSATANGGPGGRTTGGDAEAVGGDGQRGGTVTFASCTVQPPVGQINSRVGGDGGWAMARGGAGSGARAIGWNGGDATAIGGPGGGPGGTPRIPTPTGIVPGGVSRGGGSVGTGGTASATGGPGGTAVWAWGRGGSSGTGNGTGGIGGQSGTPATPATSAAAGPTGAAGGVGAPANSPGTP